MRRIGAAVCLLAAAGCAGAGPNGFISASSTGAGAAAPAQPSYASTFSQSIAAQIAAPQAPNEQSIAAIRDIHTAARHGDVAKLTQLLDAGADVDARLSGGDNRIYDRMTPLMTAARSDQLDAVRLLLDRGANIDAKTSAGWNAQAFAVRSHASREVRVLLQEAYVAKHPAAASADSTAGIPAAAAAVPTSDADAAPAPAAERPSDYALVIGIEKYSRLPPARWAHHDAEAVKRHLLALGYPERNIILLEGEQATRGAIQGYVEEWLPRNVGPNSEVFVYFSGHGSPDPKNGDAYLVPWDGDALFLKSTAYPLKGLYASLGRLKAKNVIVALDSCFSGAGGRSVLADGARPLVSHVAQTAAPERMTILSAASGDEITGTIDAQGHGAFTYYLLKAMNHGRLSAKAAYDELKPRVEDAARRQNREQTPLMIGDDASF